MKFATLALLATAASAQTIQYCDTWEDCDTPEARAQLEESTGYVGSGGTYEVVCAWYETGNLGDDEGEVQYNYCNYDSSCGQEWEDETTWYYVGCDDDDEMDGASKLVAGATAALMLFYSL